MVLMNAALVLGARALYDMAVRGEKPWLWLAGDRGRPAGN
jgi:hypothetical protein